MKYDKWLSHEFSTGAETGEDYKKFQRAMKADLKKQAADYGMEIFKFLPNHYEFSAVLQTVEGNAYVYVSIPDVRFWKNEWFTNVLYRRMLNESDWSGKGGQNLYCNWTDIGERAASLAAMPVAEVSRKFPKSKILEIPEELRWKGATE